MDSLTDEQRARIAKNREEALKRLEERKRRLEKSGDQPPPPPPASSSSGGPSGASTSASSSTSDGAFSTRFAALNALPTRPTFAQPNAVVAATNTTFTRPNSLFSNAPTENFPQTCIPTTSRPTVKVNLAVVDQHSVKVAFNPFNIRIVDTLKTLKTSQYNEKERTWTIRFVDYDKLVAKLRLLRDINLELNEIPAGVKMVFHDEITGRTQSPSTERDSSILSGINEQLVASLFPYQRRGVIFGIEKGGRVLIADEMGLGKSIQALAIAQKYNAEWPLLIICPSSVKSAWKNQINKFLPDIKDLYIIDKCSDALPKSRCTSVIVIMSYDQMSIRLRELIDHLFYVVIFDESHLLKEMKAKRTKAAIDIAKKATRVILLSGTPALSRPVELFPQVKIINPKIFPYFQQFGIRYCDGRQGRFAFEMKGATNTEELTAILQKMIMIRRLKKDVLNDLPAKRRELIYLSGDSINHRMKSLREARDALIRSNKSGNEKSKHESLMQYYIETGIVKSHSVAQHIVESYFYEGAERRKILIFAHHTVVLDTITMMIARKGIKYIRIDGATPQRDRGTLCERFQNDDDVLAAVLSITAAGIGITLTAASIVVFAELHWNPGSMLQAEDRAHRVGQRDSVLVQYMLAKNTADDEIWPLIEKKLKMLGSVNLSSDSYKDAENLHRDCSDRVITQYLERLNSTSKDEKEVNKIGIRKPKKIVSDEQAAEDLEVIEIDDVDKAVDEDDSSSVELIPNNNQYEISDDDDININNDTNDVSDVFGTSHCGGFEVSELGDNEEELVESLDIDEEGSRKRSRL